MSQEEIAERQTRQKEPRHGPGQQRQRTLRGISKTDCPSFIQPLPELGSSLFYSYRSNYSFHDYTKPSARVNLRNATICLPDPVTFRIIDNMHTKGPAPQYHDGSNLRIGIVHARWNDTIIEPLVQGAKDKLLEAGVKESNIVVQTVPGAWELPIAVQRCVCFLCGCSYSRPRGASLLEQQPLLAAGP